MTFLPVRWIVAVAVLAILHQSYFTKSAYSAESDVVSCSEESKDAIRAYTYRCLAAANDSPHQIIRSRNLNRLMVIDSGYHRFFGREQMRKSSEYWHVINPPDKEVDPKYNDSSFASGYLEYYARELACYVQSIGFEAVYEEFPQYTYRKIDLYTTAAALDCDSVSKMPISSLVSGQKTNSGNDKKLVDVCFQYLLNKGELNLHQDASRCPDVNRDSIDDYVLSALKDSVPNPTEGTSKAQKGADLMYGNSPLGRGFNDGPFVNGYLSCYAPAFSKLANYRGLSYVKDRAPNWYDIEGALRGTVVPEINMVSTEPASLILQTGRGGACQSYLQEFGANIVPSDFPSLASQPDRSIDPLGFKFYSNQYASSKESIRRSLFELAKHSCVHREKALKNISWCFDTLPKNIGNGSSVLGKALDEAQRTGVELLQSGLNDQNSMSFIGGYIGCQAHQARCITQPYALELAASLIGAPGLGTSIHYVLRATGISCGGERSGEPIYLLADAQCAAYMAGMPFVDRSDW